MRICHPAVAMVQLCHLSETKFSLPWRVQKPGFPCSQPVQQQKKQARLQPPPGQQALVPAKLRDRYVRSSCGSGPALRPRYAPRTAHDSAARVYPSFGGPTGRQGVRLPVGLQVRVLHSSCASLVHTLLDLLTQKVIAQYHFAGRHAWNGFYTPPNLLTNAGGGFSRTQWACQVTLHRHLTIYHLHLVQQAEFAKRTTNPRVACRPLRCPHAIDINLGRHRDVVPVIPVSWATFAYSRLRWAISSFSISLSLLSASMP